MKVLLVKQTQQANSLVSTSLKEFAAFAKTQGCVNYREVLTPAAGKAPCLVFNNPGTGDSMIVVLSKATTDMLNKGTINKDLLKTLKVIEGKNAKGEERYYLSRNGMTEITVDELLVHISAVEKSVQKLNEAKLAALIA